MTRINGGVQVDLLTDQHLFSEYREIGRIATLLIQKIEKNHLIDPPPFFKLNKGHMLFFLDKGKYIVNRFNKICKELKIRGIDFSQNYHKSFYIYNYYPQYYNDWIPKQQDIEVVKERIAHRVINSSQKPKFYKRKICSYYYIEHILKPQNKRKLLYESIEN